MEDRNRYNGKEKTNLSFQTIGVTGSIIILTNFQKILMHFKRLTFSLPDTTNLVLNL